MLKGSCEVSDKRRGPIVRGRSVLTASFSASALFFLAIWIPSCPSVAQTSSPPPQVPLTWQEWTSLASAKINKARKYPSESAVRHEGGTVRVEFVVDSAGFIITSRVVEMSCYDDLNNEALEILRRASPLPPFPVGATKKQVRLVQELIFNDFPAGAPPNAPKPRTRQACQTS
jgi:TonB family protein